MRRLLAAVLITTAAAPALADDTATSALIAAEGLGAARAALEAEAPSPDRDMALAAVTFLGGIEGSYQSRWDSGLTEIGLPLPVLGTPLAPNPNPAPLTPDYVNRLAADLGAAMQATRAALPEAGSDGAVVLKLSDIWFDIDRNGTRTEEESLLWLAGFPRALMDETAPDTVRFDAPDAHWLRAYTHLIEGSTTLIRAFDPEPELARALALRAAIAAQHAELVPADPPPSYGFFDYEMFADTAAVVLNTLRHQPDPALIAETEAHARAMIAANRDFWTAVAAETDNDREWIPNDAQQQALGLEIPPGTGAAWVAVLADAEKVLNGDLLVPFWRFAPGNGVDLRKWLDAPAPIELIDWIQGTAALEYAGSGAVIDGEAWSQFLSISGGNAGLYMVMFN